MTCCHCQEAGELFDHDKGKKELRKYRRKGPTRKSTRVFIDGLRSLDLQDKTLMDIGGGVGAVPFELFREGIAEATFVEASPGYAQLAKNEARRRGYADRTSHRVGDVVEMASELPEADLVTLDRVICCYPDLEKMVRSSTDRAARWYGVVYPKERWYTEAAHGLLNLYCRARDMNFRMYVHDGVDDAIRAQGFVPFYDVDLALYRVTLYEREELVDHVDDSAIT